ncbi:uncharacterized protein EI90DRAFT_3154862 [Cantharellus anzutake]|uniref:uncharacterized protein n=1 Tax=Cantharellus anzutake TaxID=1750568 RepID=UPI0019030A8B|nr:uncharacterized protein EI90DRAFT_3154862 [Cantharellus anzutake]KAF8330826.1 hypothetical protein EI90DRAFT_3154862 [Cantharellus anzutake]
MPLVYTTFDWTSFAAYRSPRQSYSEPQDLIKYVASLYNASPSHITSSANATHAGFLLLSDNAIDTEHLTPRSSVCAPLWSINGLDIAAYSLEFLTRCTRVYAQVDPPVAQGAPIIYKQVMGRLDGGDLVHHEMEILDHIHKDGYIAGVVRGVEFDGESITIDVSIWDSDELNQWNSNEMHGQVTSRRSSGMIYLDTGVPISKGTIVLDLLAGFFDIVEGLRYIVERHKVVHRDTSPSNIYIYAKSVTPQNPAALAENILNPSANQPTFINKYLDPDNPNHPRVCRDFETVLWNPTRFWPMPELQGEVLHTYGMLFGAGAYEAGQEDYDGNNIHGLEPEGSDDSESMQLARFKQIFKGRRYRDIDMSTPLFLAPLDWWSRALHPEMGPVLGELLNNMGLQVGPEYNRTEEFRRLLLQAIVTLNQQPPITLDSSRRIARLSPYGPSVSVSLANSGNSAE